MKEPSSFMPSNKSKEWVCYKYNMQKQKQKNDKKIFLYKKIYYIYASNIILTSKMDLVHTHNGLMAS